MSLSMSARFKSGSQEAREAHIKSELEKKRAKSDKKAREAYPIEVRAEFLMKAYFTYHEMSYDRVKQVVVAAYQAGYSSGGSKYRARQRKFMEKIERALKESL